MYTSPQTTTTSPIASLLCCLALIWATFNSVGAQIMSDAPLHTWRGLNDNQDLELAPHSATGAASRIGGEVEEAIEGSPTGTWTVKINSIPKIVEEELPLTIDVESLGLHLYIPRPHIDVVGDTHILTGECHERPTREEDLGERIGRLRISGNESSTSGTLFVGGTRLRIQSSAQPTEASVTLVRRPKSVEENSCGSFVEGELAFDFGIGGSFPWAEEVIPGEEASAINSSCSHQLPHIIDVVIVSDILGRQLSSSSVPTAHRDDYLLALWLQLRKYRAPPLIYHCYRQGRPLLAPHRQFQLNLP